MIYAHIVLTIRKQHLKLAVRELKLCYIAYVAHMRRPVYLLIFIYIYVCTSCICVCMYIGIPITALHLFSADVCNFMRLHLVHIRILGAFNSQQ